LNHWYYTLHRSSLTPPGYVIGMVWTFLYILIGTAGWCIWGEKRFKTLQSLYLLQLVLNWTWSPMFFNFHWILPAFLSILLNVFCVGRIILLSFVKIPAVAFLLLPYFFWLLFAGYLNFYIWYFN